MDMERRKGPRFPVRGWAANNSGGELHMWLDMERIPPDFTFLYETRDIGPRGLFLETSNPLPTGDLLDLELTLPGDDHAIRLQGRVVRTVEAEEGTPVVAGMGIELLDLSPDAAVRVDRFLREHGPDLG